MSIEDDHPSNGIADLSIMEDDVREKSERNVCDCHKAHKTAELQWGCFPGDIKGIVGCVGT